MGLRKRSHGLTAEPKTLSVGARPRGCSYSGSASRMASRRLGARSMGGPMSRLATRSPRWANARRRGFALALTVAALLLCCQRSNAGDTAVGDIARALREWKDAWVTLRCRYEHRNPAQLRRSASDPNIKNAASLDGWFHLHEWTLLADGSQREQLQQFREGALANSRVTVVRPRDSLYFTALWKRDETGSDRLVTLDQTVYNPPIASRDEMACFRTCSPLRALYNIRQSEWLGETLEKGAGELEGIDEFDGCRCARVKIGYVVVWFDLEHGALPCRADDNPEGGGDLWSVLEFQTLPNGKWFPKRGTERAKRDPEDETATWLVVDVSLNDRPDGALFEPPAPALGTIVRDYRSGRFYTVTDGAPEVVRPQPEERLAQSGPRVSAEVTAWERYRWPILLLIPAVLVLGIGAHFYRRG